MLTLLFAKLKKNKIENLFFLLPSFIIFILIMDQDIKNNEKSALVHQYSFFEAAGGGGHIIKLIFVKSLPIFAV